jgi:hypothetical protein
MQKQMDTLMFALVKNTPPLNPFLLILVNKCISSVHNISWICIYKLVNRKFIPFLPLKQIWETSYTFHIFLYNM